MNCWYEVVDNCLYQPLSDDDVYLAYGTRLENWNELTAQYQQDENTLYLPRDWPLPSFESKQEPTIIWSALRLKEDGKQEIVAFVEASAVRRDTACVRDLVLFPNVAWNADLRKTVVRELFTHMIRDFVDMQIERVVVTRCRTAGSKRGARYVLPGADAAQWEDVWCAIAELLSTEYRYMYFETPFAQNFIQVSEEQRNLVQGWLRHTLFPTYTTLRGRRDFARSHDASLWRKTNNQPLEPREVDILIRWQRFATQSPALLVDPDRVIPVTIFDQVIFPVPEHVNRMELVGFRHLQRVPPDLVRSEVAEWTATARLYGEPLPRDIFDNSGSVKTHQQAYDEAHSTILALPIP